MHEETEQLRTLIGRAAMLRALGASWPQVAVAVDRTESTVKHWPSEHRAIWQAEFQAAGRSVSAEAGAEAMTVLRNQLRAEQDGNEQYGHLGASTRAGIAWRAANSVMVHTSRQRPKQTGRHAPEGAASDLDDLSLDELVEQADRHGVAVPEVLRQRLAGDYPGSN